MFQTVEKQKDASILGNLKIKEQVKIRETEYLKNPKRCLHCDKIITYNDMLLKKKFCNRSCAAKYNNTNRIVSEEQKRKTSETIKQKYNNNKKKGVISFKPRLVKEDLAFDFDLNCSICGKPLTLKQLRKKKINIEKRGDSKKTYCSAICRNKCEEYRKRISLMARERVAKGTHKGWMSRNVISYPEKFFMRVLENNGIKYEHNYVVKKSDLGINDAGNYFLDFYIGDKKLDLEIDGKQHFYKERQESDKLRDDILMNNGYHVYRIKWKNPNNEKNKEFIKRQIDNFINYYNGSIVQLDRTQVS